MKKIMILFIVPFLIFGQDLTYVLDDNCDQSGCTDPAACNYDQDALLSNNSCLYDDGCVNIFESL